MLACNLNTSVIVALYNVYVKVPKANMESYCRKLERNTINGGSKFGYDDIVRERTKCAIQNISGFEK